MNKNILLLVEGAKTEPKLFKRIFELFPEMKRTENNIVTYNTNIWHLEQTLSNTYSTPEKAWYDDEINFINFIKSQPQYTDSPDKKFTDIYLIFDYERQDPNFDGEKLKKMMKFFNDPNTNGKLYINYPMVESYRHLKNPLPDIEFLERKVKNIILKEKKYKSLVGEETGFPDLRKITRNDLAQIVIHTLCKASYISGGEKILNADSAKEYFSKSNELKLLDEQNKLSTNEEGMVYILATCLFFIPEYNKDLIF